MVVLESSNKCSRNRVLQDISESRKKRNVPQVNYKGRITMLQKPSRDKKQKSEATLTL